MSTHSKAEVIRQCRYLLNLVWSLRRLWGVAGSEREQRLLGTCLRQRAATGENPPSGVGLTIDGLWDCLDSEPQHYAYAVTVLLELDERELDFIFEDQSLWQTAYWGDKLIAGPPQWPLAYELLRQQWSESRNLNRSIEVDVEMIGLQPKHGNVYWERFCRVLRNLVAEECRHEFATPLNWRRVAERLQLSCRPPLGLGH